MKCLENKLAGWCAVLLLAAGQGWAETALWSDNFETNAASRWTTNGVWKVGVPTAGPTQTPGGTRCAATGLTSDAPANADARFICTNYNGASTLTIPATNQFPRLRFSQWFNYVNGGGDVEIRMSGSTNWQAISGTNQSTSSTADYSGGVWSRPSIDLSAFAGTNVQIAFHFTSGPNIGSDPGWYIDDVAVVTNTPVFSNPENFETGLGDWSVDSGTWEVGQPTSGPNAAHSGTNCAGTVLAGNYGLNMDTRLISPPFLVPTSGSPSLRFSQWYNFVNAGGFVEIKISNGSWQSISQTIQSIGSSSVTSGGWTNAAIDLSAYFGQTVQVAFHFQSGNATKYGTAPGWYVDNVSVTANPVLTVPATQTIYAGETLTVTNYATLCPTNGTATFALLSPTHLDNLSLTTNGVLTWVTDIAQPPGTNTITIQVTDNNSPALSATNSFVVIVSNPWVPVLTVPSAQTIYAGQKLVVTNSATNPFFPHSTFTFVMLAGPTNMDTSNLPANGVLTWATTTAQSAGTNTIVITATDNNSPALSATNSFVIVVTNPPLPVLTVPSTQTIYAGRKLVVTNSVTNSFFPNCKYTFSTMSAPAGVLISSASGVLTWMPTAAQAPSINSISVQVTDNNPSPLSAISSFKVIVSTAPPPPTLMVPGTQTNYAGQTLAVTLSATNSYLPGSVFTYSLPSPSTNYSINATSGVLTWTNTGIVNGVLIWTNSSVSPGTNLIAVSVSDDSVPALSATNNFKMIFLPAFPPSLILPTNPMVYAGQMLTLTNRATNSFLPAARYIFGLPSPSTNVSITTNGVLTWTNTAALPGTNVIFVTAMDNSVPPLFATNSFNIRVTPTPPDLIVSQLLPGSHSFQFTLNTLSNTTWRIDASSNLLNWQPVLTNVAGTDGLLQFTDLLATNFPQRFYRAVFP